MKKCIAIAMLTVREAFRSRIMLSFALAVALSVILVPLTIKNDGTPEGRIRVALQYSLTLVSWLLAVATVWAACRSASLEIEERQVHLVVTKPVRRAHIWLGKWIGILAMDAILLAGTGILDYAVLQYAARSGRSGAPGQDNIVTEEILTARRAILPRPDEKAANTVSPGSSRQWHFSMPRNLPPDKPFYVRFELSSPRQLELEPLAVRWLVGRDDKPFAYEAPVYAGEFHSFPVPASAIPEDGKLTLTYVNAQTAPPAIVSFDAADSVTLLARAGSFDGNLCRAILIIFCKLAPLAALGVAAGCLLSMPVACFAAYAVVVVFMFGGFIRTASTDPNVALYRPIPTITRFDSLFRMQFRVFNKVVSPVQQFEVLESLPRGELIPWSMAGKALLVLILVYSGIPAIIGIALFKHRELGLPPD